MADDFIGRPWHEVEAELRQSGLRYETEITRPTRDFFRVDEKYLYVLRERKGSEGSLRFVLAARSAGSLTR